MESVRPLGGKISGIIELIKFEHSIFALPFAMMSLFMVYRGAPDLVKTLWIVACMVSARSASMSFNRIVDYTFDMKNPRTSARPLQKGKVSVVEAWAFTIIMSIILILCAGMLNRPCFYLSFVLLFILFGYSFMKRFSASSHLVLGFSLGLSPIAVWIAVTGSVAPVSALLCAGVTFWVAGFDVLYALQDLEFDRREGLKSIPARYGASKALDIALLFHCGTVACFIASGIAGGMGVIYYGGLALISAFLFWEHHMVRRHGLSRINTAFFTVNGLVSILFFVFSVTDIFLGR